MNPCECGCEYIGTDVSYIHGVAMFCQMCGIRGPRVHIEPDDDNWYATTQAEAMVRWNEQAQAKKLQTQSGDDLRFSA